MRDGVRRLQKDEAVRGFKEIHPSPSGIARHHQVVLLGLIAKLRQFEPVLAVHRAMAVPTVASPHGKDRNDIFDKADPLATGVAPNVSVGDGREPSESCGQGECT